MSNEKIFDLLVLEDGCNFQLPYSILIEEKSKNFIKKLVYQYIILVFES